MYLASIAVVFLYCLRLPSDAADGDPSKMKVHIPYKYQNDEIILFPIALKLFSLYFL